MAAVPSIGRATLVEAPHRAPQAATTEGLYERHAPKILGYCLHQLGSREEAEDAVQTTFMNAFRALGRGVVPEAEVAWLFKIAENVCLSRRRSSWRRGRIESPSDFEVIEEIVPGPSRQRDELIGIEDALASMPEQQRRAILLREWQGLSYREIADELEVSQSAVETLIFRARRSLAQGLEQPDTLKKPKRKGLRRALHALDVGTALAAIKTFLAGSAAVKATAAAVAVTAAAGTAAGVAPKLEGKRHGTVERDTPTLVAPSVAQPAEVQQQALAAAYVPSSVVSEPVRSAPAAKPTAGGPKRKPQKIAEKATAKPPVRKPVAKPVAAAPAAQPAAAPIVTPLAVDPAETPRAEEPKAKEQAQPQAKHEPKAEPQRAPQAIREERGPKAKGKDKAADTVAEPAPAPSSLVAPVEVVEAVESDTKTARAKGRVKHASDAPDPATDAAAATAPAEVAALSAAPAEDGKGSGKGNK